MFLHVKALFIPSTCAGPSKETFLHQPPAQSLQAALARVVPSFLPRATTPSTESGSPVWVIGTVQRVILEAQNEAFGKQLLVEPKRPREETPWSRARRNVLLRGRVFKDTSGVCFLATRLIQNMLAVSEHPMMPTSTVENTIKICRVHEESLSVAPPVGRETQSPEQMQQPLVSIGELRGKKVPTQGHQATFLQAASFRAVNQTSPGRLSPPHTSLLPRHLETQRPIKWSSIVCNQRVADLCLEGDMRPRSRGSEAVGPFYPFTL